MADTYRAENSSEPNINAVQLTASGTAVGLNISDILIRKNSSSYTVMFEPDEKNRPVGECNSHHSRTDAAYLKVRPFGRPTSPAVDGQTVRRVYPYINTDLQKQCVPDYNQVKVQKEQERVRQLESKWPTTIEEARRQERLRYLGKSSSTDTCSSKENSSSVKIVKKSGNAIQIDNDCVSVQRAPGHLIMVQPVSESMTIGEQGGQDELFNHHTSKEDVTTSDGSLHTNNAQEDEDNTLPPKPTSPPRKTRGKFRRALRIIGKCLSHWCYPALDSRD